MLIITSQTILIKSILPVKSIQYLPAYISVKQYSSSKYVGSLVSRRRRRRAAVSRAQTYGAKGI